MIQDEDSNAKYAAVDRGLTPLDRLHRCTNHLNPPSPVPVVFFGQKISRVANIAMP